MPNAKGKHYFVAVKFDAGGKVIPQKKSKQVACQKIEFWPEAMESLSLFGVRKTHLLPPFRPITPKPFPETRYPQKFAEKQASGLPESENQSLKPKNTASTAAIVKNHVQQSLKLKPKCSNWIQHVKCYVGSKAPYRRQVSTSHLANLQHCSMSEKDLSGYNQNFVIAGFFPILLILDQYQWQSQPWRELGVLPCNRTDSKHCVALHKPKNRKQTPCVHLFNVCDSCKMLHHELNAIAKKTCIFYLHQESRSIWSLEMFWHLEASISVTSDEVQVSLQSSPRYQPATPGRSKEVICCLREENNRTGLP